MSEQSERAARWREHVERWRRSGQTQSAYCAEHGVSKKSLGYWIRQWRQGAAQRSDRALTFVLVFLVKDMEQYTILTRELFFENNNVKRFRTLVSMSNVKLGFEVPSEGGTRRGRSC
ncbi:hypothetical protein U5817_13150 [Aromatoleum evansii]|uniref:Transposase n=1 Tax=Aromatoleum evansii TaxID=59406 RepID=A0ABZ1AJ53_AROEV|nr:hypothetical protein U5817_13150 [Aromatoleum evansii]